MAAGLQDKPRLTRSGPAPIIGIVHLGPGAFFRAFNAVYTDEAMQQRGGDWGIVAVSLRSPTSRDQLDPQAGVFTSVTLGPEGWRPQVIGSIAHTLVAPEDPQAVIAAMSDPAVKIVSLTITEKGYCVAPSFGALDLNQPDIAHDLAHHDEPRSAVGFIVAALEARRRAGAEPFTVLSCDNLPSNGALARAVVLEFASQRDSDLADWIARTATFPSTMVDRITPATTTEDIDRLATQTGHFDAACVFHEGFRQWVIEDNFVNGRPAWDAAGAQFVASVEAHETMKLRCLNGTHSTLAYLGYLAGYETIAETVTDPDFVALCDMLWREEIIPTLTQPDGEDLPTYCSALMTRYKNPSIRHRTWQIAMDGSQKLPQRLLGTMADNLALGHDPRGLALAVAGWMRYVGGTSENGQPIDVRDPLANALRVASDSAATNADRVAVLLAFAEIFPSTLNTNSRFRSLVEDAYDTLVKQGAKAAVRGVVAS
ncbi:mannitol dehydrogenase family protein [Octadecabacter sp.]|nr:mannitol dehydrogenase family protein [Octadecabacter sp.]MDC1398453.1 mannitol dehydrogenase family protein [Octadecabacter sp.]MDC1500191.1 mannitol dehydrogenase family protein [Octadecabacter sp.]